MRCSNCGSDNPAGKKFCEDCGGSLENRCPKCGAATTAGKRFCGECGEPLNDNAPAGAEPRDGDLAGERRHLTVLFCDLVGSTGIAAQLDPEEWREVVAGYQRAAGEVITRYGGSVAKYLGDGVMAYFGYPEAHENDAERAVRAALSILDAVSQFNRQLTNLKLSARIGIDSGAVVVGRGAGKDADVFGDAPNIAARVQALAPSDAVLITAATHRLVSGLFVVEDRGAQALKGYDRPIQVYRVVQPSGVRGRLEAAAATRGLTPFVGREEELRLLINRWERALDGEGQVALIVGEAGIGKSRLLQHFHQQIVATPHTWAEAAAAPSFQNTPFYPIADLLRQLALPHAGEPVDEQLTQLEPRLTAAGLKPAEAISLIAPLLNLPVPAKYPPLAYSPQQQRRRLLAMMVEWVLGAARVQPLIIATEDLHWADPSTMELIQLLVEQGATGRLLLLYTARPEFRHQWPLRAHHTQITLNRLSARSVRTMVGQVAARNALSDEAVAAVVERTGGVPLFVEELTRAVLESDSAKLTGREIPVTLHDSLMARLDRLGLAKEAIQIGAVIGSEFSYELLHAVHPMGTEELQSALRSATDAELVYVRGIAPEATYQFKHTLIRDAAYEALLKSRRRELHREVAVTIDGKFPMLKEAQPEMLARHWAEAGEADHAITEWQRAGRAAEARSAFTEARESYQQALALLELLPKSPERDLRELELARSVVRPLIAAAGYSAPETVRAIDHAAVLAEKSGSLKELVDLMISRGGAYGIAGNFQAGAVLADRALELALREGSPVSLGRAHTLQIFTRFSVGDLAGAEEHFLAGVKFFEDPDVIRLPMGTIDAFALASWSAWMLGRADVARDREARMMAVRVTNAYGTAWGAFYAAFLRALLREYDRAEASAAQSLELAEQHQFAWNAAHARAVLGDARWRLERVGEGIALLRRGVAEMLEVEERLFVGIYTAHLATALEREGAILDALETVEQALQLNSDPVFRPEILRVRGELRCKQGQTELAEADFREAIVLAQKMRAKAWELRATISLARLLTSQDRRAEAHTMLAEIYNWFTEGFDTADLKDAKALLDELAT